ncbi:MAG: excinuclease ABC subunit UvrC [Anaerolineae bacterium]|nr:excinuclease ABC subunit UvrC [Anaerolineae bacterium]
MDAEPNGALEIRPELQAKLESLPAKPGVYIYRNEKEQVIYVGKSVTLRHRVRSYFTASAQQHPKTHELVAHIHDFDFIVTDSELEALILECELIKKYRPRYNVRLKDDKRYPYIKITLNEDFPRIYATRRMESDGARYYGPYTSVSAVHQTLDLLRKLFPYRTCNREITGSDKKACLYYHIGRCLGPCIGAADRAEYGAVIDRVCKFLEGRAEDVLDDLQARMVAAVAKLDFEGAAVFRDQIRAVQAVTEQQKMVSVARKDQDVIAFARDDGQACVQVFFIRSGKVVGREYFVLEGTGDEDDAAVMEAFVEQFYDQAAFVPPEILLPHEIDQARVIESWLRRKRQEDVVIDIPHSAADEELVQMVAQNAAETLNALRAEWDADQNRQTQALQELQEALGLTEPPARVEGYDISTFHGTASYGSMVVFVHGVPRKSDYRRFKIKTVIGHADDFASMQEMLRRRFRRFATEQDDQTVGRKKDSSFATKPDLLLIDGGKGQLSSALEILSECGLDHLPVFGLAKREEEIFVPGRDESILLPRDSPALYLIQRIRDEAHRFAITAHRNARDKQGMASILDAIPGIGPARRKALLKAFGSVDGIREATEDELAAVPGMTQQAAHNVKEAL